MSKKIDLSKSVYELVREYPELAEVMAGMGFTEITKKLVLNSVGRMTTIPQGAKMKGFDLENVLKILRENGFEVEQSRTEQLKDYLPCSTLYPLKSVSSMPITSIATSMKVLKCSSAHRWP